MVDLGHNRAETAGTVPRGTHARETAMPEPNSQMKRLFNAYVDDTLLDGIEPCTFGEWVSNAHAEPVAEPDDTSDADPGL